MDALALLKKDHQTVEKLFARFEKKPSKETADRFVRELSIHAAVEEQLFYPALRKLAQSEQLEEVDEEVLEALEEHHVAKWVLSEIEGLDEDDERFEAKCMVLIESVRHHVKEEEGSLFRFARRLFKRDQLAELGKLMQKAKKMAPTHPHPRAPDEPPGNILAGGLAAILDRGRDAVKGLVASRSNGKPRGGRRPTRELNA
ncbi:MAG TPA: hemerythrin domain-containing protein [Myxococcales bacterium]|jgi:hemerythrin superfamily protein|nr:hemerythrin domain-containing protein [Myxococcales bacterium]